MKVFVAGATGILGRRLVDQFTTRGHEVVGLTRDEAGAQRIARLGGTPRRGDVLEPDTLKRAIDDDTEVLLHAATAVPDPIEATEAEWARNDRVRLEGMSTLLEVAPDSLRQVLFPSVVWVARQPDGSPFDERANRHPDRMTQSAAAVERLLEKRAGDGFDAAILRCGLYYAPDARDMRTWAEGLLAGRLPIVGSGLLGRKDVRHSFVHTDDAAAAFVGAVESGAHGIYHVVDDEPVSMATMLQTLARLIDASEPRRIPGWLARLFLDGDAVEWLTSPVVTTNTKTKADLGWEPTYPTVSAGLEAVVDSWRQTETLAQFRDE